MHKNQKQEAQQQYQQRQIQFCIQHHNNNNNNNNTPLFLRLSHTTITTTPLTTNMKTNKMALGKSIKMYLTIFIATTCIYMVLYQYHLSRDPLPVPDIIKTQQSKSSSSSSSYASFLWAPMSIIASSTTIRTKDQRLDNPEQMASVVNVAKASPSLSSSLEALPSTFAPLTAVSSLSSSSVPVSASTSLLAAVNLTTEQQTREKAIGLNQTRTTTLTSSSSSSSLSSSSSTILAAASSTTTRPTINITTSTSTTTKRRRNLLSSLSGSSSSSTLSSSASTIRTSIDKKKGHHKSRETFTPVSEPPPLYIITPTFQRPEQLAELTRLGYTLKHVVNLLWLVIEDANKTSELVTQTLNRIGVSYEYLTAPMPEEYKQTKKAKPRGVSNRNRGMDWIRANATEGVFYFADDDNTYDISIFEQMRYTKKVSMWPVGLVTKFGVSSPIVRDGKIEGYYDGWIGGRKFPVDMAGFAVSVRFLHERPEAKMPYKPGYEEDGFLKSLAPLPNSDIELLASECTEILTWHTQTKKNENAIALNMTKYGGTNLVNIHKYLVKRQ